MKIEVTYGECMQNVRRVIADGTALNTLAAMVAAQGGNRDWILDPALFPKAKYSKTVTAPQNGYIVRVDTEGYGIASLLLGAGRNTKDDVIDMAAGISLCAKTGDRINQGDPIAILYSEDESRFEAAEKRLLEATEFGASAPAEDTIKKPLF